TDGSDDAGRIDFRGAITPRPDRPGEPRQDQRSLAAASLFAAACVAAPDRVRDRVRAREPEASAYALRLRDGERVADLADPAQPRDRPRRRGPPCAARAPRPPSPTRQLAARSARPPTRAPRARRS